MRDCLQHLKATLGQFGIQQTRHPGTEKPIFMHNHRGAGRLAGGIIDGDQIIQCRRRHGAKARPEAEGIGQAARDDLIRHADIHNIGQVIARRCLGSGQADRAREAAHNRQHAFGLHFLNLGHATIGGGARIAEHHFNRGTPKCLDAAAGIDIGNGEFGPEPAIFAILRKRPRNRLKDAKLDSARLRLGNGRGGEQHGGGKQSLPPRKAERRHWRLPCYDPEMVMPQALPMGQGESAMDAFSAAARPHSAVGPPLRRKPAHQAVG